MKKEKFKQLFTTLFTALITLASDTYDSAEKRLRLGSNLFSHALGPLRICR